MLRRWSPGARGPAAVFVKADWCPHCRAAGPEVRAAASVLGDALPVYVVDADADADTVRDWDVRGFPTILLLAADGSRHEYRGDRTARAIADWACIASGACSARRSWHPS